jgi:hypothetical protein
VRRLKASRDVPYRNISVEQLNHGSCPVVLVRRHLKVKLKESEDMVTSLKNERERLEPVIVADRKAIQAVFDLQDERNRANIWRERWIGFGFGVLASVVASIIYLPQ